MLLLTIVSVRVQVVISYINNGLYTALQQLDAAGFGARPDLRVLAIVALVSLLAYYVQQRLDHALVGVAQRPVWATGSAAAPTTAAGSPRTPVDNPDQRIQEDIASFPALGVASRIGAVSALVSLVSFTLILWQLSGPLPLLGVEIPRAMTFVAYLYVIVATVFAFRIGAR